MTTAWRRVLVVSLVVVALAMLGLGVAAWAAFQQIERMSYDLDGARQRLGIDERYAPRPGSTGGGAAGDDQGSGAPSADVEGEDGPGAVSGRQRRPDVVDPPPDPRDDTLDVYLIVGLDAEDPGGGSRADVILLGMLPGDGADPALVSLPRDLWIEDLCHGGKQRINAALLGCGSEATGQELMMLTVEHFTGLPVDHYVEMDFDGFAEIIDVIGGIEICTDHPVRDARSGLSMPAGCVQADGDQALAWVRSRRTEERVDGTWRRMSNVDDLTRNERQRQVLLDVAQRVTATRSLRRIRSIAEQAADEVVLGESLSTDRIARTAWRWRGTEPDDVRRAELDVEYHVTSGGASVLLPDEPFTAVLDELDINDPDAEH